MPNHKEVLVPAGRWKLITFKYGRGQCMCCGRTIWRNLYLQNLDHEAKVKRDPDYKFPETITIGCVCGPDLFKRSCIGFYENPEMEWARQYAVYADYIKYVILCAKSADIWNMVPADLRGVVDSFLDGKWKEKHDGANTGPWWRIRDAKRRILAVDRDSENRPRLYQFRDRIISLEAAAKKMQLIPEDYVLGQHNEWQPVDRRTFKAAA